MKPCWPGLGLALWVTGICLGIPGALPLGAQEEHREVRKPARPAPAPRFFDQPIDFWSRGLRLPAPEPEGAVAGTAPLPTEPRDSARELPRPLQILLDQPTPENVRAYFEWRMERARKLIRAAELIEEYRQTLGARDHPPGDEDRAPEAAAGLAPQVRSQGAPVPPPLDSAKPLPGREPRILYFHRKDCPHCVTQDEILRRWTQDKPEIRVLTLEAGGNPETWKMLGIRGTPTLLFQNPATGKSLKLEGLSTAAQLDQSLGECRQPSPFLGPDRPSPSGAGLLPTLGKGETP